MPVAPEVAAITATYRTAQARNAALIGAFAALTFRQIVTGDDIDAEAARWIELVMPRLVRQHGTSAQLARQFYARLRLVSAPDAEPFEPPDIVALADDAARTSLRVTGPVALKAKIRREPTPRREESDVDVEGLVTGTRTVIDEQAFTALVRSLRDDAAAEAGAAAVRHVQSGGRDVLEEARKADPAAIGYYRATALDCCHFCAMLASRGAVYDADSFDGSDPRFTGLGTARVHDSCACQLVPVFARGDFFTARTAELAKLWSETGARYSGRAAINAFRRAYDAA